MHVAGREYARQSSELHYELGFNDSYKPIKLISCSSSAVVIMMIVFVVAVADSLALLGVAVIVFCFTNASVVE